MSETDFVCSYYVFERFQVEEWQSMCSAVHINNLGKCIHSESWARILGTLFRDGQRDAVTCRVSSHPSLLDTMRLTWEWVSLCPLFLSSF